MPCWNCLVSLARFKLKRNRLLSRFAFNFNLRRYSKVLLGGKGICHFKTIV